MLFDTVQGEVRIVPSKRQRYYDAVAALRVAAAAGAPVHPHELQ